VSIEGWITEMTAGNDFSIAAVPSFVGAVSAGSRARAGVTMASVVKRGEGRHPRTMANTVEIDGAASPASIAKTLAVRQGAA
jgi:hypothetical protein